MGPEDRHQISPLPALVRGWTQQVLAERGDRYLEAQSSRQGGSGRPTGFLLNPGLLKSWSSFLLLPLPPPPPPGQSWESSVLTAWRQHPSLSSTVQPS